MEVRTYWHRAFFSFAEWSPQAEAGTYPDHMLFVQSDVSDPGLHQPLLFAYSIPAQDAAHPDDVSKPYNASSRSRINGLGSQGISFINTGRGRDVGAAVLTLNTSGIVGAKVSWTADTLLANSRIYALRMQYRVGLAGDWIDVLNQGAPVEYIRSESGELVRFDWIALPAEADDQPLVFLRWVYHHVSGTSGPRAQLRLDDILVQSGTEVGTLPVFLPTGSGDWNLNGNWSTHIYPQGAAASAFIPAANAADRVISITGPVTIGHLSFGTGENAWRTRLTDVAADSPLTFDGGLEAAALEVSGEGQGWVEFNLSSGVVLSTDLRLDIQTIAGGPEFGALRMRESWTGTGGLIKSGPGRLRLLAPENCFPAR
ncbi:MAG: hypothetical protein LR015_07250 [Verrucomicrobia bacterium]|nr:hypothetical protein [Verrucomicrobiota bacterium]